MKFDVFKVPFHPFNLVNNLKCFQYSFATIMYLTQKYYDFSKSNLSVQCAAYKFNIKD